MTLAVLVADVATSRATFEVSLAELEPASAVTLRDAFDEMFAQTDEWAKRAADVKVTSLDQIREMRFARECRLALREIRVNAEKARKRLKEDSVRRGKAIDGLANVIKACIEPIEAHLLEQETFADRHEQTVRDEKARQRTEVLVAYGVNPATYTSLGEMADDTWETVLEQARLAHEKRLDDARKAELVRIEAQRIAAERLEVEKAEAARLEAERVERERVQAAELEATKAQLAAEAEQRKAAEQARVEADQLYLREKYAADLERKRELAAVEAKAANELAQANQATADKQARLDEVERLARAAQAEDILRVTREAAKREAAELAPDRDKLRAFADGLRTLAPRGLTTERGKKAGVHIAGQLAKLSDYVSKIAGEL